MVESFKPEYKGSGRRETSGRDEDTQLGKIRTGRLRRDYDRSVLSSGETLSVSWKQTKDHQARRGREEGKRERGGRMAEREKEEGRRKSRRERIR